ncbi:hypothetical protein IFM89_002082 [Coptis chinensis]|uniref:Small auxin up regulated protein n=1 Tax=Coptis chinensis TaxID=261450 RepID=A0A835LG15_9MAGN|nr:hypothetical protein IFM89_002082 [Coptis chinensis]
MSPITDMKKKLFSPLKKLTTNPKKEEVPKGFLLVYVGEESEAYRIPLQYISSPLFPSLLSEKDRDLEFEEVKGPIILSCTIEKFEQFLQVV